MIQVRYSTTANDVWDTFIEAPSQDFPLQAEVLSWAQSKRNMNLVAQLWQYLDASDSLRYNLSTTANIIYFINQMSNFPVKDAEVNQICHIAKTMLEMLADKREIWTALVLNKVGCVLPTVIWPEFRLGQHSDHTHREHAPHFKMSILLNINSVKCHKWNKFKNSRDPLLKCVSKHF